MFLFPKPTFQPLCKFECCMFKMRHLETQLKKSPDYLTSFFLPQLKPIPNIFQTAVYI